MKISVDNKTFIDPEEESSESQQDLNTAVTCTLRWEP